jgi:hypothetical protein
MKIDAQHASSPAIHQRQNVIKFLFLGIVMGLATVQIAAAAEPETPCPGHPEALGTSRVLAVDPAATPRVGRKHFPTGAIQSDAA